MPYGRKQDADGNWVDFDEVYRDLIVRAVTQAEPPLDLRVVRCDDIEQPGWIHARMIEHISRARVAIVDTSMLNANVFYELGVRHALQPSVTVLLHREGTTWPFNIAGLSSISYGESARFADARKKLAAFIRNGLADGDNVDSLVHLALPELRVELEPARRPRRVTEYGTHMFQIAGDEGRCIGFATGDYEELRVGEAWATSENTNMQMDSYYGRSTSATVRYLGARKHAVSGRVVEDTIANLLTAKLEGELEVEPATVVVTEPGSLRRQGVKWIFHTASVVGQPREGYRPIVQIERCVRNALAKADGEEVSADPPKSILLPIFGTGPAGGNLEEHLRKFLATALAYLKAQEQSHLRAIYFYVWSDLDLETCLRVATELPEIGPPVVDKPEDKAVDG